MPNIHTMETKDSKIIIFSKNKIDNFKITLTEGVKTKKDIQHFFDQFLFFKSF